MALSWSTLTATTREVFVKKLEDNIYDSSVLLKTMLMDQSVMQQGGRKVVCPLEYVKSTSRGFYSGYDTFNMEPPENITASEYTWGNAYATIAIDGDTLDQNKGEAQVLDLIATQTKAAEKTLRDLIATALFSGENSKGIIGLNTAVGTGTYGGISTTDFTGWVSGVDTSAHTAANMKTSTNASYILTLLQNAFRSCLHMGEKPNLIVTTPAIWDIFENVLQQSARYNKTLGKRSQEVANAGFDTLEFRGVPIVYDEYCPDYSMYVLNTNYLKFYIHPDKNFKFTGFQKPINQDAQAGQILLKAQLAVTNRRMHYKFTNLAAS